MDRYFMNLALEEAKKARDKGEVPIGAVIVRGGEVIGKGYNKREMLRSPLAHAEILAIDEASRYLDAWRLLDCTLYVTIEPCIMCAGAIVNSRIERLVIGADDPKMGACGTVVNLVEEERFNHRVDVTFGVMREECSTIMSDFFRTLRKRKKSKN